MTARTKGPDQITPLPVQRSVGFVPRENIKHFTSRLKSELHPRVRSYMQKLLVREEDKLGADLEFLAEVDQTIIGFDALIETQSRLVATLEHNGGEAERERATLNGLRDAHVLCQMYRQKILVASEKTVLYSAALEVGPAQRQKQRGQMLDDVDRSWPPRFLSQPAERP